MPRGGRRRLHARPGSRRRVEILGAYRTPLLWLGITMNLASIGYLAWRLRQWSTRAGCS